MIRDYYVEYMIWIYRYCKVIGLEQGIKCARSILNGACLINSEYTDKCIKEFADDTYSDKILLRKKIKEHTLKNKIAILFESALLYKQCGRRVQIVKFEQMLRIASNISCIEPKELIDTFHEYRKAKR